MDNKELLPCAFCGEHLIGEVDDECNFHTHPKNDCFFSEWEFDRLDYAQWNRRAPAPQAAPVPMHEHNARFAIDGAIQYGRENRNKPPSDDHWLMEYWLIGQQLRELGKTGWDNRTPLDPAEKAATSPAPAVVQMTDEQIGQIAHQAYIDGRLNWIGFKKDAEGKFTIPVLSKSELELVRAILSASEVKNA